MEVIVVIGVIVVVAVEIYFYLINSLEYDQMGCALVMCKQNGNRDS